MPDGVRKYHLEYHVVPHPEGITTKELRERGMEGGLTDAVVITSILRLKGDGISIAVMSRDGREDRGLNGRELFEAWALWAKELSESDDLGAGQRALCESVWNGIRVAAMRARKKDD